MRNKNAFHGGKSINVAGSGFQHLDAITSVVRADTLDAWFGPSPKALSRLKKYASLISRSSPPTHADGLRTAIVKSRGLLKSNVLVGAGSSDLMFVLLPFLSTGKTKAMVFDPMYGEYQHIFENVLNLKLLRHSLDRSKGFAVDLQKFLADIKLRKPDIVVIVNPNSPTGVYWPKAEILKLLDLLPKGITLVVDEAYIDYLSRDVSLEKAVARRSNLIVIKSMSKVYALSGARVGYLVAPEILVKKLEVLMPPWNINFFGQLLGVGALEDPDYYGKMYKRTHQLRNSLIRELKKIKEIEVFDSVANFVLIRLSGSSKTASDVDQLLKAKNVYVRNCDSMSAQFQGDFIRLTVGDSESNKRLVKALKEVVV